VVFDVAGGHAFDGEVKDTSGSSMSSTTVYVGSRSWFQRVSISS
jgi:hypothetical protein